MPIQMNNRDDGEEYTVSSAAQRLVNALPMACLPVTPVKVVARMITDRPIRPTQPGEKPGPRSANANTSAWQSAAVAPDGCAAAAIVKLLRSTLRHRSVQVAVRRSQTKRYSTSRQVNRTADHHRWQGHGRHAKKELRQNASPAALARDNQVLRPADHGHDAAERGPDAGVHHHSRKPRPPAPGRRQMAAGHHSRYCPGAPRRRGDRCRTDGDADQ